MAGVLISACAAGGSGAASPSPSASTRVSPGASPSPSAGSTATATPKATPKTISPSLPSLSQQTATAYIATQVSGKFKVGKVSQEVVNGASVYLVDFAGSFDIPSKSHLCRGIPKGEHVRSDAYRQGVAQFALKSHSLVGTELEGVGKWKPAPAVTCK